jgi:hypothetical protein
LAYYRICKEGNYAGGEVGNGNAQFPNHILCRRLWIPHSGWARSSFQVCIPGRCHVLSVNLDFAPSKLDDCAMERRNGVQEHKSLVILWRDSCTSRVPVTFTMGKADEMSHHTCLPTPYDCFVLISFNWYASFQWHSISNVDTRPQRTGSLMTVSYRRLRNSFRDIVSQYPFRTST